MNPIHDRSHADHRIAALTAEAAAERLAAAQRRRHEDEHDTHPTLRHPHRATGVRRAVGRLLIALGGAIAGTGNEAGAGRAA